MQAAEWTANSVNEYVHSQHGDVGPIDQLYRQIIHTAPPMWVHKTPKEIRIDAVYMALTNQEHSASPPPPSFLSVRAKRWRPGPFISILTQERLYATEPLPDTVNGERVFIKLTDDGQDFILSFVPPGLPPAAAFASPPTHDIIAFDPGVHPLLTGYTRNGHVIKYNAHTDDSFQELIHWMYTKDIETVVYPSDFVIPNLAVGYPEAAEFHRMFLQVIETKFKLVYVDETLTTKTCSLCGHVHDDVGQAKIFHCPSCSYSIHRDVNAARNILFRYLDI